MRSLRLSSAILLAKGKDYGLKETEGSPRCECFAGRTFFKRPSWLLHLACAEVIAGLHTVLAHVGYRLVNAKVVHELLDFMHVLRQR